MPFLLGQPAHGQQDLCLAVSSTEAVAQFPDHRGRHWIGYADRRMLHPDTIALDSTRGQVGSEFAADRHQPVRPAMRPAIYLVVCPVQQIRVRVTVIKCHPLSFAVQPGRANQEIGFGVVGPDHLGVSVADGVSDFRDDREVQASGLLNHVDRKAFSAGSS